MTEDHWHGPGVADVSEVGVTQPGRHHAHKHLAVTRLAHVHLVELWQPPALRQY
jgi:hypothetical protein